MQHTPDTVRHFRLRQYLAATFGWPAGAAILIGIVLSPFAPDCGPRVAAFGCGLLAVAMEIDPTDSRPWWLRAGLAFLAAVGALFP